MYLVSAAEQFTLHPSLLKSLRLPASAATNTQQDGGHMEDQTVADKYIILIHEFFNF